MFSNIWIKDDLVRKYKYLSVLLFSVIVFMANEFLSSDIDKADGGESLRIWWPRLSGRCGDCEGHRK